MMATFGVSRRRQLFRCSEGIHPRHRWIVGRARSCLVPSDVAIVTFRPIVLVGLAGVAPLVPLAVVVVRLLLLVLVFICPKTLHSLCSKKSAISGAMSGFPLLPS